MMRFGVLMNAFREKNRIESAIKQFDDLPIEEIVVSCSKKPWKGNLKPDNTSNLALKSGVTIREYYWEHEHEQKNWGMEKLSNMDWILIFAPDMYMTKESIRTTIDFLENENDKHKIYGCAMKTYWKNFDTVVKPDYDFEILALKPKIRFQYSSITEDPPRNAKIPGVMMHHISWVKTDTEMRSKLKSYSHADEVVPNWYNSVWKKWKPDMIDLHPTSPTDYRYTSSYSLPDEIKELLNKNWLEKLNL